MSIRLTPKTKPLGGGSVQRLLPQIACRQVGPWVFFDRFGPRETVVTADMDIRPHPHCGLSTVTFLFDGAVEHRDSTGGHAIVRPGEIHWMRGGHGVVHSERVPRDRIGERHRTFGLQLWCAHPDGDEEQAPGFGSWRNLPRLDVEGVEVDLLAGEGWSDVSPVDATSDLVYAVARMQAGQRLRLPDHAERCVYPVVGEIAVDGERTAEDMLVLEPGGRELRAITDARVVILGGAPVAKRYIWWNLVHSDRERLREQAERWRRGEFPAIPGDDDEPIPAPELGP